MPDWAALVGVAWVLYVVECVAWIEAAAWVCFRPLARASWRCARGADLPGNDRGGLVIVNPLLVSGCLVSSRAWPFSVSPDGLTDLTSDAGAGPEPEPRFIPFDGVESVETGFGEIRINRKRFVRIGSQALTDHLADEIHRIWKCGAQDRASEIEATITRSLDRESAAGVWAAFRKNTRPLVLCCAILLSFCFVVLPVVLFAFGGLSATWPYLLAGLVACALVTAAAFYRIHAALFPHSAYDRWVQVGSMILLPVAAIRCADKLSRDVLHRYSRIAIAPLLCGASATPLLRRHLVDLENALAAGRLTTPAGAAQQCASWFERTLGARTQAALEPFRLELLQPPPPDDPTMAWYCPRCHAQFGGASRGDCAACPGVLVLPFTRSSSPGAASRETR